MDDRECDALLTRAADDYDEAAARAEAILREADRGRIEAIKTVHFEGGWSLRRISRPLRVSHTIVARLFRR